jgi:hypothetical protein
MCYSTAFTFYHLPSSEQSLSNKSSMSHKSATNSQSTNDNSMKHTKESILRMTPYRGVFKLANKKWSSFA